MIKLKELLTEALGTRHPSGHPGQVGIKKGTKVELFDGTIAVVIGRLFPRSNVLQGTVERLGKNKDKKNIDGKKAKIGDTIQFSKTYVMRKLK